MDEKASLAILGAGNIGTAMATGLVASGQFRPDQIILTRRKVQLLDGFKQRGFLVQTDNSDAVRRARVILVAVEPQQLVDLLREIGPELSASRHKVISVVSGVSVAEIVRKIGHEVPIVRAMPNTAVAIRESMTCLAAPAGNEAALSEARSLFDAVGVTVLIDEELMIPATALCACGVAFFLRAIRAASQGGIEIGFHAEEALIMAAQTARGAASLILHRKDHPETEIDRVTTPRGCTIAGLNLMEHEGFSSALIRGIVTSADKAAGLYRGGESGSSR